jgi:hypothetical protein
MTPEKVREAAAVMLAFADGKKIECRRKKSHPTDWVEKHHMRWAFEEFDYRVAPEPWTGKIWVHLRSGAVRDQWHFNCVTPTAADWKLITAKEVGDE